MCKLNLNISILRPHLKDLKSIIVKEIKDDAKISQKYDKSIKITLQLQFNFSIPFNPVDFRSTFFFIVQDITLE